MKTYFFPLALLLCCSQTNAQSVGGQPFIAVQGEAKIDVVPDRFPIRVTISDKSIDTAKTQAKVEEIAGRVFESIKSFELDPADIDIGNLEIDPDFTYDQKLKTQVFVGNEYVRRIGVTFHSLADLKRFISSIPSGKEVAVSTIEFEIASINEIRRKLVADAMADARTTAEVYANAAGQRVWRVQTISDKPLNLSVGSYINAIDVSSTESSTILTAEQIARIPVGRNITNVALLAPGTVRSEVVLKEGVVTLTATIYVIFLLRD